MSRGGGLTNLDDLGYLVFPKHSDGLLELFDTGFESVYLFMQFLRIAQDETLQTFRGFGRFRRVVFPVRTEFPFRP
jgi:hypothetical protein